jgi:hypothetical protein
MKKLLLALAAFITFSLHLSAQDAFGYDLQLVPVDIPNLPGLHSYAFGQHDGKWIIIGGRRDGLHARQPFNSFPASQNNTEIFVVDVPQRTFWKASVTSLPTGLAEQLQSTNLNFFQDGDDLYIIGGYAYSASADRFRTFPNLAAVNLPGLVQAIISGSAIAPYFKQISHDAFAVTGGQLGKIGDTFYLVGGHRFDGRYNPHGPDHGPGFVQTYTNEIRKFSIRNTGDELGFDNYETIADPIHLRRRDYNLLPQIFPDGSEGYTISSGVFQINADLPFLYPVDITASGYTPIPEFNQYLCNYHSASAALYDEANNQMHSLFFGGISQYYYQDGQLIQDNQVPFVRTISRLTRFADGSLQEYQLPIEMPGLKGASAEFIVNQELPHTASEIILLGQITGDTILIGHVYGGILSPSRNPFSNNQTNTTNADPSVYAVRLIKSTTTHTQEVPGKHRYGFELFPNPVRDELTIDYELPRAMRVDYFLSSQDGKILQRGHMMSPNAGENRRFIQLDSQIAPQALWLTLVFDHKYYATKMVVKR